MNENKEIAAAGAADTLAGTGANEEAQNALLEGFLDDENDWPATDETGVDDDDDLILEAEPDNESLTGGAAEGRAITDSTGDAGGAAGRSGEREANGANGTNRRSSMNGVNGTGGAGSRSGTGNTGGAAGAVSRTGAEGAADTPGLADAGTGGAMKDAEMAAAGAAQKDGNAAAAGAAQNDGNAAALRPGEEPKYKVQLYGREQEMTVPELVAAAQRGLERDQMRAQLDAAQQALPALRMVEQYAAANGMTAAQYLQLAEQNVHRQAVGQLMQKGVPEETARELVDERLKLDAERRVLAPLMQRINAEEARKKARDPWLEVTREYPDVTTLPESVMLSVQRGERPLAAMRAWELEQLRAKLSAQEMQLSAQAATLKNRQTTPGSAAGAADTKRDAFLDALFGTD